MVTIVITAVIVTLVLLGGLEVYRLTGERRQRRTLDREERHQQNEQTRARKQREADTVERLCRSVCETAARGEWKHTHSLWTHSSGEIQLTDDTWVASSRMQPYMLGGGDYDTFTKEQTSRIRAALTRDNDFDTERTKELNDLIAKIEPIDLQVAEAESQLREWVDDGKA